MEAHNNSMAIIKMFLLNAFHPDVRVYKEAKYLFEQGHDVEILALDTREEFRDQPYTVIDGIKVRRFFCRNKKVSNLIKKNKAIRKVRKVIYFFWFLNFVSQCKKYLKHNSSDFLHCHDLTGMLAGYLSNINNSKLIFDMHEYYEGQSAEQQRMRVPLHLLVSFFQSRCYKVIYVADMQKTSMNKKNLDKLVYLPNYPDVTTFLNNEKTISATIRVAYIGLVRHEKLLHLLLSALGNNPQVELGIHGSGELYDVMKRKEQTYSNLSVTGHFMQAQVATIYSKTDILYYVYDVDCVQDQLAFPVKFFEAIITKTPLIVSKNCAVGDFCIKNKIGFAVSNSNSSELKDVITLIIKHPQILKKMERNIAKIQYNYTWEKVVQELNGVYPPPPPWVVKF